MTEPETEAPNPALTSDARQVTVTLPQWVTPFRDPGVRATAVLAAFAVVGFVMFGLAWRGTARTAYVPLQVPWLVSGGLMGIGFLGLALGAWSIHASRRQSAAHSEDFEDFVREAAELAENLRTSRKTR